MPQLVIASGALTSSQRHYEEQPVTLLAFLASGVLVQTSDGFAFIVPTEKLMVEVAA